MTTELIVSVFNRTELLRKNLLRFRYIEQPDFITIVNDGGDGVELRCMLEKLDFLNSEIRYIYHNNPDWDSCSIPKNIGLKNSRGDILIYTEPENMFIDNIIPVAKQLKEKHYAYQQWVYFGKQGSSPFPVNSIENPLGYIEEYGWNLWKPGTVDVHGGQPTYTKANMVSPWTLIVRREDLMKINGWDEDMSFKNGGGGWGFDDIDLITRLRESGVNAYQAPFSVIHQWHDRPPAAVQDSWEPNEKLMKAKQDDDSKHLKDRIMANPERTWGIYDGYMEVIAT